MNWPAFANPWMLGGLLAVGLPVLIHYLTRARPKRVPFPPFKFLIEACAGQQSIYRLRKLILLTLRCLAVLALVLLFSRPFLKPRTAGANADANKRVVLVIDASLSMRAVQGGVTLFGRAQSEAADVLRGVESGSEAAVILAGATPRPLLPALSANIPALHEELVKSQPTFESADFTAALAQAKRMLGSAGVVYIFSDFQKSNWESVPELPGGLMCRLRPVTSQPVENVGIIGAKLAPAEPVAGESTEVVARVFNSTPRPREEIVRLQLGEFAQERRVTVPAFASQDAAFEVIFPHEGSFTGKVWLTPDDLREDDTRYLAVQAHKALQVLLVSDPEENDRSSAAFFISRALVPSEQAAPGLKIARRHGQDTDRGILETADVFVLVAPATLSGEAFEIISRRVQEGARFVAILDGTTASALVPAAFNPPFQLQRAVFAERGEGLVLGPGHLFPDADQGEWSALRFRRHLQTQVPASRNNEVLLSWGDGSAALTLSPAGKGAAVFMNIPLTADGGDLIGSPMFPSTVHELMRLLRRGAEEQAVNPGAAWVMEVAAQGEGAPVIAGPDGQEIQAQVIASGRKTRLAMPPARLPGIYSCKSGAASGAAAVNIDPRETDTRSISLDKLKTGEGTSITVLEGDRDLTLAGNTKPLWPALAAAAAACLALEMCLLAMWRRN